MANIVLCMIVKDEAHVIERCLRHALPAIDAACICDTGSTDETPELIERVLGDADIPYRICRHDWIDFGTNRTQSYAEARSLAQDLGWDIGESYAYVLDADMILRVGEDFDPGELDADGYKLRVRHSSLTFSFLFMLKLAYDWQCIGAAHEYWSAEDASDIRFLDSLAVDHLADGGVSDDKLDHYRRLLEADLERDPDNARTVFYLGQTHFDLKQYDAAREFYCQRAEMDDWPEEAWYARYRAAVCTAEMDGWESAAGEFLGAWADRPERAEPLYALAYYARRENAHDVALMAAERALQIPIPEGDLLFVDHFAYRQGPTEVISIAAFYTGQHARGADACDVLIHNRATHQGSRRLALSNSRFYVRPLFTPENAIRVGIPHEYLTGNSMVPGNVSIRRSDRGYLLVNRLLNYYLDADGNFLVREPETQYISSNVAIKYDRDLDARSVALLDDQILENHADVRPGYSPVRGVEDLRLVRWNGAWWFTGNSFQFGQPWLWQVVLGRLNDACTRIESLTPLNVTEYMRQEKNWLPFVHEGRLLLLYGADPTLVLEPDPDTGTCRVVGHHVPTMSLEHFRGSSPLIPFNGRYLGIVHEVVARDAKRTYLHRFFILDPATWKITHVSHPFTFLHTGVEYCCGLTWAHEPTELLLSFSFEERESWIARIDREQVREMLLPIESLAQLKPLPGLEENSDPRPQASALSARPKRPRWLSPQRLLRSESD